MRRWLNGALGIERVRLSLAAAEAVVPLALLGLLCGIATGALMLAFRAVIEGTLALFLPNGDPEAFERLEPAVRAALPLAGAAALTGLMAPQSPDGRRCGIAHVLLRLDQHEALLPLRNALVQFIGGAVALISGQSLGREGPAVHLGAAASSLVGQLLDLPRNALRTLVACGTAAAIAGSFNTPMAGVIFAMEVIVREYTVVSFIPVILAAVAATVMVRSVYGDGAAFEMPLYDLASLAELWWMVVCALAIGAIAALFIETTERANHLQAWPVWMRLPVAGAVTAGAGLFVPEVLGIGYDTVEAALYGALPLQLLALLLLVKLLATAISVGAGMPAGVIGPTLVMGAAVGGIFGLLAPEFYGDRSSEAGYYALLGMGAMMGAVLQAPLAALVAVLELTLNPNAILPAMLMIVVANLTASEAFGKRSVFVAQLRALGLTEGQDPVRQALRRLGVAHHMERRFVRLPRHTDSGAAREALARNPLWIVVDEGERVRAVMPALDLRAWLETEAPERGNAAPEAPVETTPEADRGGFRGNLDLIAIPATRLDVVEVDRSSTLAEAHSRLREADAEAALVRRRTAPLISPIVGILTCRDIEKVYDLGA